MEQFEHGFAAAMTSQEQMAGPMYATTHVDGSQCVNTQEPTLVSTAVSSSLEQADVNQAQQLEEQYGTEAEYEYFDVAGVQFTAVGLSWTQYFTEENYAYYLCEETGHSQVREVVCLRCQLCSQHVLFYA